MNNGFMDEYTFHHDWNMVKTDKEFYKNFLLLK